MSENQVGEFWGELGECARKRREDKSFKVGVKPSRDKIRR